MTEYAAKQRLCGLLSERFADILHSSAEVTYPLQPFNDLPFAQLADRAHKQI